MPTVAWVLTIIAIVIIVLVVTAWLVATLYLRGPDLAAFDEPRGEPRGDDGPPSAELQQVLAHIDTLGAAVQAAPRKQRTAALRDAMDHLFDGRDFDASFVPVDGGGVRGEWVLAPGVNPARRTLYLHGGAFVTGSPRSHRPLTSAFSAITGGAVLALDYRLMPEHSRRAGIEDCRNAWRWMLAHGPGGAGSADTVFVAGDSAGGNLTLSLLTWLRDAGSRIPDAAVAMSPLTDNGLSSPSLYTNLHSDPMLGPNLGDLLKLPRTLLLWGIWARSRINPRSPTASPVYGDLSGLPPVLVQVSDAEMLRDDGRRYANRARAAGSPVRLQVWPHMPHVWQMFNQELPEARAALEETREFLATAPGNNRRQEPAAGSTQ